MLTTIGFQIAFYSLCAMIVALAFVSIVQRRRRARLLAQRSIEPLDRLDRLQRELQSAEDSNGIASAGEALAANPAMTKTAVDRRLDAGLVLKNPAAESSATTWQDRTLFAPQTQSGWRGSPAIPMIEAHEIPSVDTTDYVYGAATPILAAFLPEGDEGRRQLVRDLKQAGDYAPHARENLAATRFLFMIGSLLLGGVCVLMAPRSIERMLLIGTLVMTGLGWALPSLLVKSRAKSRRTEVERAIPDMMDMLNMCVSQGLTVPDSFNRLSVDLKPVYPDLAQELSIVVDQAKVGTLNEALQNFADRIDLPQVDSFTSLLIQSERMGTSVSQALTDYSDTMRESLRQRADERANQASFSLLFPTVLCLMPAVFLFLMGPAAIELSKFTNAGGLGALSEGRQAVQGANRTATRGGANAGAGQP